MFLLELKQAFRTHGIPIHVISCSDQGIIEAGQRSKEHAERTFGKRRGPSRLDTPPVFTLPIGANLTANIIAKELNQEGEQAIRLNIPGVAVTQQEASPGQSHIEVGISSSTLVSVLQAAIPF